jgi:hypothetical protein
VLIPHKNWNGKEQLTFFASDGIFEISDFVNVTIIPINDAPEAVFINKPENGLTAKDSTLLIFQGNATDPDLIYGDELSFKWYSDKDGVLGIGRSLSDVRLKPGRHRVTLMVTDSSNLNGTASINITIVHPKEPSEELTSLIVVSPIVIILIIVAIFIILRYLRHRRDESENSEKNDKTNTRLATGVKEEQEDSVDKLDNTNQ